VPSIPDEKQRKENLKAVFLSACDSAPRVIPRPENTFAGVKIIRNAGKPASRQKKPPLF
jgi:hypothetical protein